MRKSGLMKTMALVLCLMMLFSIITPATAVAATGYTYYFLAPDNWFKTDAGAYNDSVGVYWWQGDNVPSDWPGYEMEPAPEVGENVFKVTGVSSNTTTVIFNAFLDGSQNEELYKYAHQTVNINVEGYDEDCPYDKSVNTDNFNGWIFVLDLNQTTESWSGSTTTGGAWFTLDNYKKNSQYYGSYSFGETVDTDTTDTDTTDTDIHEIDDDSYVYYFQAPESWLEPSDNKIGAYWWLPSEGAGTWPGKEIEAAPEIGENVFKVTDMSPETNTIIFNNLGNGMQTVNINTEGYDEDCPYDSSVYTDDFNGWIYLIKSEEDGLAEGAWFTLDDYYEHGGYYEVEEDDTDDVPEYSYHEGDIVTVKVGLSDFSMRNGDEAKIAAYNYIIEYDPEVFTLNEGGDDEDGFVRTYNATDNFTVNTEEGKIYVADMSVSGIDFIYDNVFGVSFILEQDVDSIDFWGMLTDMTVVSLDGATTERLVGVLGDKEIEAGLTEDDMVDKYSYMSFDISCPHGYWEEDIHSGDKFEFDLAFGDLTCNGDPAKLGAFNYDIYYDADCLEIESIECLLDDSGITVVNSDEPGEIKIGAMAERGFEEYSDGDYAYHIVFNVTENIDYYPSVWGECTSLTSVSMDAKTTEKLVGVDMEDNDYSYYSCNLVCPHEEEPIETGDVPVYGEFTYYFLAPDDWYKSEAKANNDKIGAYWWQGENAPADWPGTEMTPAPEIGENVFKIENVTEEATTILFNAFGGEKEVYSSKSYQTVNINTEGYDNDCPYDSSVNTDNFDGWIFVLNRNDINYGNDRTPALMTNGAWFTLDDYKNYKDYYGTYGFAEEEDTDVSYVSPKGTYHAGDTVVFTMQIGNMKMRNGDDANLGAYNYEMEFDSNVLELADVDEPIEEVLGNYFMYNVESTDHGSIKFGDMKYNGFDENVATASQTIFRVYFTVTKDTDDLGIKSKCTTLTAMAKDESYTQKLVGLIGDAEREAGITKADMVDKYTIGSINVTCPHADADDSDTNSTDTQPVKPDTSTDKKDTDTSKKDTDTSKKDTDTSKKDTDTSKTPDVKKDTDTTTKPSTETKDTDTAKSTDTAKDTDTAKSTDTAKDTDTAKSTDTAKDTDTAKSTDTAKDTDTAKSTDTAKDTDTAKSTDTAKDTDTAKSTDTAKDTDTATSTDTAKDTDTATSTDTAKDTDTAKSTDTAKDTDEAKSTDTAKDSDTEKDTPDTPKEPETKDEPSVKDDSFTGKVLDDGSVVITGIVTIEAKITIPSTVDGKKVTKISDDAFKGNKTIANIVISAGITTIGDNAFADCTNLAEIVINADVTSIADNAFAGCEGLIMFGVKGSYAEQYALANNIPFVNKDNLYGDIDEDGEVNSADALEALRNSVQLTSFTKAQEIYGDVNLDGVIDAADALDVLRYSVKSEASENIGTPVR